MSKWLLQRQPQCHPGVRVRAGAAPPPPATSPNMALLPLQSGMRSTRLLQPLPSHTAVAMLAGAPAPGLALGHGQSCWSRNSCCMTKLGTEQPFAPCPGLEQQEGKGAASSTGEQSAGRAGTRGGHAGGPRGGGGRAAGHKPLDFFFPPSHPAVCSPHCSPAVAVGRERT